MKTEREFAKCCAEHGFQRLAPRFYARCIGDGVYQTIYTGFKRYLSVDSPHYSPEHRKTYYISIGIRSVYSALEEFLFIPGKQAGGFRPADLKAKCRFTGMVEGIETEYAIMEETGFDVLDSIDTQEALIEWWDRVQTIHTGGRVHDLCLVEPLLLCGWEDEALSEISINYMHDMCALESYRERVSDGRMEPHQAHEQRILDQAKKEMQLWRWCLGRNHGMLEPYISQNYARNMGWIDQYGIPVAEDHQKRTLQKSDKHSGGDGRKRSENS